ncbi:transport system permease protein [Pseudarthrobacter chlorophenolicus A6]|uniref:Transport system permease protein n=1 Tax=Pseudarthrobacter chlorophenolicus (strain ATCC 700700 / DSM 12829 / CIP 107037 / JCM 12360 / KCTC 9906 / NCIMB 13794 / A6) TaxID=452863 RepID=B8HEM3_PSECP|nr:iron ABC transporter permease [Pseudarthrobacter chlorophenolicus]ACL40968.1 transport system permease protein [Pseudarthrobacter chlorophenolicus A6]SDQ72076.1 iron complex transport system permease protein [Pseudarthrobacter chlorophenolicus]
MTHTVKSPAPAASPTAVAGAPLPVPAGTRGRPGAALVAAAALVVLALFAVIHLTQGTADVGPAELLGVLAGNGSDQQSAVLLASRIPRLLAGLLVGVALGVAGAALQSATRNVLASPDTLAVNAGAHFAIVAVAAFGITLPSLLSGGLAFAGGLAAALLVLALSGAGGNGNGGPIRLVLAGTALALGLHSATSALLLLFSQETTGLYAWGQGSLAQSRPDELLQFTPVILAAVAGLLIIGRRLDLLGLGDDASRLAGADPRLARITAVVLAVLLSAAAVTVSGPIGFVGLCAPAIVRLLASRVRGLGRHRALLPISGLAGAVVVIGADVVVRVVFGAQAGVEIPTGAVTTVFGAVFLVILALRMSDAGLSVAGDALARLRSRRFFLAVLVSLLVLLTGLLVAGALLGDAKLLLGDLINWLTGQSGNRVSAIMGTRMPRVLAAVLAGAALAIAGALIQAVSRNSLAEPGILGVSGGGGLAAIIIITTVPLASSWLVTGSALAGAALAAALVFGLAFRGGLQQNRLVLIGIGVSAGLAALITVLLVSTDPYNQTKALTWLSGSTYGRNFASVLPPLAALAVALPVLAGLRRDLDLIAVDDDSPRVLGIGLSGSRLVLLATAVLLTAGAVSSVGVIAFVGLVAPHAARSLVGARHVRVLPVAALIGACTVVLADLVGRTVIAPAQIPAGIMTALVGAPYFVYLLWRSRVDRAS